MAQRIHTTHKVILAALVMALLAVPLYLQHANYTLGSNYSYLAGGAAVAGEATPAPKPQPQQPSQTSMTHVTVGQTMLGDGLTATGSKN